jgi:hypothetical protein
LVEWLNLPIATALGSHPSIQAAVAADLRRGQDWMRDNYFNGRSAKPYEAVLLYGKGIVERELELTGDFGKASFLLMLDRLRATGEPYPSRPQHIAQALVIAYVSPPDGPAALDVLRSFRTAKEINLARYFDDTAPFANKDYGLYAGPRTDLARAPGGPVGPKDMARLLFQSGDWYLVAGRNKIGWINTAAGP